MATLVPVSQNHSGWRQLPDQAQPLTDHHSHQDISSHSHFLNTSRDGNSTTPCGVPMINHSSIEEIFPNIQQKPQLMQREQAEMSPARICTPGDANGDPIPCLPDHCWCLRYSGTPTELLETTWKTELSSDRHREETGIAGIGVDTKVWPRDDLEE